MGRGDSSLAHVGVPPVPLGYYEKSLLAVQAYLRREPVPTDLAASFLGPLNRGFDQLSVAAVPDASQMTWMPDDYVKPELEAAASGPKVIAAAARHADRISFALGADVARLKWAIHTARNEADKMARDPGSLSFGAFIPCYPHHDQRIARDLARGTVASMTRFSAMHKKVGDSPISDRDRQNMERIAKNYDMKNHGDRTGSHAQLLDPEFIDNFGLVGDPQRCLEKMMAIRELGIDRLILWTGELTGDAGESYQTAVEELLPAMASQSQRRVS
jgi:5,10-methylenetetrahydromethanopterin reductase